MADIIYMNLCPKMQSTDSVITVEDVAEVEGRNKELLGKIKKLPVYEFTEDHTRRIISQLKVVYEIEKACPSVMIVPLGAEEVILEYSSNPSHNKAGEFLRVVLVSCISFFGPAFTIMAFHNDIGIRNVFEQISALITGAKETGVTVLEVSYSIGLASGIILFFNHIGKRRITHDPTPIEVSMRKYEDDVNSTLAETWDRKGETIDAP
ncbi:MAG: stage V sporulation protein AA [Lachnospiraceae bacterium]|nr:stage V sporulation protein AA [Lachnospiraceae bacterium]